MTSTPSHRQLNQQLNRRRFLRATAATAGLAGTAAAGYTAYPAVAEDRPKRTGPNRRAATAEFRWLGTAGWRIDVAGQTVLVDPYLSRYPVGMAAGTFDPATPLSIDTDAVDEHTAGARHVFITHTHWDHVNDVPRIVSKNPDATVYGTLTTYHVAAAMGVPTSQLSVVKGGEVFDYGSYRVEIIASLHSRNAKYGLLFPGVHTSKPQKPTTIADLPEGDTVAFQLTVDGGPSVFFSGASDFVERNLTGLKPDVAMVPLNSTDATYRYVARLMRALDNPATVVPVHWDNFETPLKNPPTTDDTSRTRLNALVAAVRKASPNTKVVIPEYLKPYRFG